MSLPLVMETLDQGLSPFFERDDLFATAFLATIEHDRIAYVSAGHPDALLFHGSRAQRHLPATGPTLGIFAGARFEQNTVEAAAESNLVVVTDGVLDARIATGQIGDFGLAKMIAEVVRNGAHDVARSVEA